MYKGALSIWLAICLFAGIPDSLWGQAFEINSLEPKYVLTEEVEVLEEPADSLSIEEVINMDAAGRFIPLSSAGGRFVTGPFYWARARIANRLEPASGQSGWVLHFAPSLTYIDAYIVRSGQVSSRHHTGFFRPYYEKEFRPRIQPNLARIILEPGETATLYYKARAERRAMPPEFWVEMVPVDVFWSQLGKEYWSSGLFLGFVIMMLLYNLILSFFARDKAHFFYSLYLITIIGYQLYASRLLADWMASRIFIEHPQYLYFFKLVVYGGLASYLGFIRSFLHLGKLLPGWDRLLSWLMALAVPVLLADASLIWYSNYSPNIADWAIIPFTIIFVIATFLFVWPLFRTGNIRGYFVVAGIVFMGLGILFTIIERLQSIEYSSIYFKTGSVLEIIAFALGLAYSRREEARERQLAEFELEKSRLLQEKEHAEAKRLKDLADLKSLLYANITHEFRTPLTVIMGMAAEIEGHDNIRRIIHRNGNNMLRLVNQLLALSKLESGQMELELIQANIIAYLQYLAESFHSLASTKHIRLAFYSEADELLMDFDEEKIQYIAYNLLSNAIKFTPEYGKATFHAREEEQDGQPFLQIIVQDSGVGIAKEHLPFIFDRFFTGSGSVLLNATSEEEEDSPGIFPRERAVPQSTGIGLALVKELVELMGGAIIVESKVGVGSKFIVRLPVRRKAPLKSYSLQDHWGVQDAYPEGEGSNEPITQDREAPILLLVEDNPDVVVYIRTILETDYNIYFARNGKEGLALAIEQVPDIIISDVMMPEMDGFELCNRLKQDERTSHIPIILLTARAADEDKIAGLKRGADAYLTKPFNKEELLLRIEKLIEKQRQLQEYFTAVPPEAVAHDDDVAIESAFLQKLRALVEAGLGNQDMTIADFCEAVHLSHTQVYRKLKALTKKTPSQFIRSIRLDKAMELLNSTDLNISQIAYDVGFNDPNYFSRSFLQEFGVSPSSVRRDGMNDGMKDGMNE
ncbi:MAG: response regulator [Lewinellaceae bacterium]|nr:response regulator [Phaeodactylibacter sp.]MCB0612137.1 response regulator [Phaeodactylibacter sp.]MCB9348433.1 response regulator [Lewinellaceae bacterium]